MDGTSENVEHTAGKEGTQMHETADPMLRKMAEGYLEAMGIYWSKDNYKYALVPITGSDYPELVIWDFDKSILGIYKTDEDGNCLFCGEISMPEYDENASYEAAYFGYSISCHEGK